MMGKINLKILICVIAVVVVVTGVVVFFSLNNGQPTEQTQTTESTLVEPDSVQDIGKTEVESGVTAISYANALVKYADRRIQLDTVCQAHPNTVTYKDNTGIMIDNRSPQARTIKVGTTFTIKPWGFKIVVLPDTYLASKTLLVDCDGSQNVATILVQE